MKIKFALRLCHIQYGWNCAILIRQFLINDLIISILEIAFYDLVIK